MVEARRTRGLVAGVMILIGAVVPALAAAAAGDGSPASSAATATQAAAAAEGALSFVPATLWIRRGDRFETTAKLTLPGGLSGYIRLDAANLPPGVDASSGAFSSAGEATITLTAAANAEVGGRAVHFTATSGSTTVAADLALNVIGDGSVAASDGGGSQGGGCGSSGFGAPTDLGVLGLGVLLLSRFRGRRRDGGRSARVGWGG